MSEDKNKKSTCNEIVVSSIQPEPAATVAELTGTSASYVNKIRQGRRPDKSKKAETIVFCDELILEGKKVLLRTVSEILNKPSLNK